MALYQSGAGLGALVGVGTTNPTSNLQVYGTPIAAGNVFSVLNTAASGNVVQFSSSSGTALIINASGNVGIGKTNPGVLLDVNGALTATTISGTTLTASTSHNTSGSGIYQVAGTTVIDSSRNLTNIGTIGSGAITSSSTISGTTITGTTDASFNSVTVGIGSGSVATNTAIGKYALLNNTTGSLNTAVGESAMYTNSTGLQNTALGARAMYYNTGSTNTAVGDQAMYNNIDGVSGTAVGNQALYTNTSGQYNTAIGQRAMFLTSTGGFNTALGERSMYNNTTGTNNTAVGQNAIQNNITGNNNTAIGKDAGPATSALTNTTCIGYNASASASNSVILGNGANVGIGTNNPLALLHTNVNSAANTPDAIIGNHVVKSYNLSLALAATSFSNICTITATNGCAVVYLDVIQNENSAGSAVCYVVPMAYNSTTNSWRLLLPKNIANPNSPNYAQILFKQTNNEATFALYRPTLATAGTANFTCTFRVSQNHVNTITFGDKSDTTTLAAVTTLYSYTQLTQTSTAVGIGITNPGAVLTVVGGSSTPVVQIHDSASGGPDYGATYGMVNLTRGADTTKAHLAFIRAGNFVWQMGYISATNNFGIFPFNFSGTQGTPAMTWGSNGNVGIGNTTPPIILFVPGTSTTTGIGVYNGDVAMILGNVAGAINAASIQVKSGGSSSTIGTTNYTLCLNPDGGNVSVGINAVAYKFHVNGGAIGVTGTNNYLYYAVTNSTSSGAYMMFDAATVGGSGRKYQIGSTGTGNNPGTGCFELYDATAGSTRMVVNSGGSVGIGMTNPNYTLDVNGTFRCQGSKIIVQNATNGTSGRGIFMWTEGDSNWGIYMATGGAAGATIANGTTCAGAGFTSHAIRIRVYQGSDNGFIVENAADTRMFSIRGNDSYANFAGSVQIEGAALLMNGSKNTQRGVEWDYGTGDNRYGLCQDGSGAVRVYIANGYSSGSIKFCRATTYSAFTDLWSIDYNGNLNRTGAGTINTGINMGTGGAGITWGANYSRIYDDGDLQIYTDDNMHFKNAGGERMTILNSGLIGINNTGPTWLLDLRGNGITTNFLNLATTDGGSGAFAVNQRYCATGSGGGWGSIHYQAAIYTAGTFFGGAFGYGQIAAYRNDDSTIGYFNIATNGTGGFGLSGYGNGTLSITSGRVYNSSDARMKSNINYISETSTPKIMGLKPATFTFKTDPNNTVKMGFIAQDLEQYIPIAVDAKKYQYTWKTKRSEAGEIVPDLDENGNYQYTDEIRPRSVDNMAVLAVLVKAFQEQVQIIQDLKQRIQILESAA